jgi:two-component system, NtrC family, sensor kinase
MGVRDYLTQVVLNLVLNAVDATDDQGHIQVAASVEDCWLVLTVADDGRGISIADRCRLFQPFFTTKAHGTGLGLFISRQILEDYAGTLSYRSEPGEGSTFFVRLPLEASRLPAPAAEDTADFRPETVLVESRVPNPPALLAAVATLGDDPS